MKGCRVQIAIAFTTAPLLEDESGNLPYELKLLNCLRTVAQLSPSSSVQDSTRIADPGLSHHLHSTSIPVPIRGQVQVQSC